MFAGLGVGDTLAASWATGTFGASEVDVESSFAASHMKKLGWKHGEGLGKKKDGISRAISVSFKNDTKGVGISNAHDEFGFTWWDHVFNKTARQIQVEKDSDGDECVVQTKKSGKSASKSSHRDQQEQEKQLLYGSFVKKSEPSDVIEDDEDDGKDFSIKITDEELLLACEGRTARKGARVEQPGKIKRGDQILDAILNEPRKKEKKRRKEKRRKHEEDIITTAQQTQAEPKIKKPKKKQRIDHEIHQRTESSGDSEKSPEVETLRSDGKPIKKRKVHHDSEKDQRKAPLNRELNM
ncbi:G patch domain-containing protein 4 [Entophlyctis luteolus]|nr:G patch domain-containing protein 4 [Entophlyctis luteolus]